MLTAQIKAARRELKTIFAQIEGARERWHDRIRAGIERPTAVGINDLLRQEDMERGSTWRRHP